MVKRFFFVCSDEISHRGRAFPLKLFKLSWKNFLFVVGTPLFLLYPQLIVEHWREVISRPLNNLVAIVCNNITKLVRLDNNFLANDICRKEGIIFGERVIKFNRVRNISNNFRSACPSEWHMRRKIRCENRASTATPPHGRDQR